jgi:hypothetical protein
MGVLRTLGDIAEEECLDPASIGILVPPASSTAAKRDCRSA